MDPETRKFEVTAKTALPVVTRNCLTEVARRVNLKKKSTVPVEQ